MPTQNQQDLDYFNQMIKKKSNPLLSNTTLVKKSTKIKNLFNFKYSKSRNKMNPKSYLSKNTIHVISKITMQPWIKD